MREPLLASSGVHTPGPSPGPSPGPEEAQRRRSLRWLFCCGGDDRWPRDRRPSRERSRHGAERPAGAGHRLPGHKHRRRSHKHRPAAAAAVGIVPGPPLPLKLPSATASRGSEPVSILSDEDWHEAQDAFSVASDEGASPRTGSLREHRLWDSASGNFSSGSEDEDDEGASSSGLGDGPAPTGSSLVGGIGARLVGSCLAIMRHSEQPGGSGAGAAAAGAGAAPALPRGLPAFRPPAGSSFPRRPPDTDPSAARACWDESKPTSYRIRSLDYMRTKVKEHAAGAFYRLAAVDLIRTDSKLFHICRHVTLPPARGPALAGDVALPPLLVFNLMLPSYPAPFFAAADGPGVCLVYYFALPEGFDPAAFKNAPALGLLARFVANGREADGTPTRDRLKLIARVSNPEEWAAAAPLSTPEYKLLTSYNEKPVMTRPQHTFFVGPNYLEVDVDVHSYAYLARRALSSYHSRLPTVVFENAFVIQGNAPEELPEYLLGCAKVFRTDFDAAPTLGECVAAAGGGGGSGRWGGGAAGGSGRGGSAAALAAAATAAAAAEGPAAAAAASAGVEAAAAAVAAAAAAKQPVAAEAAAVPVAAKTHPEP